MTHIPPSNEPPPLKGWEKVFIGFVAAAVLTAAVFVVKFIASSTVEPPPPAEAFCDGWINGTAYGIYVAANELGVQGVDRNKAIELAYAPDAPLCNQALAGDYTDPEAQWCNGFAEAYLQVGRDSGFGEPPPEFMGEFIFECLEQGLPATPVIPGLGVPKG